MFFESVNGLLSGVAPMAVGRNELKLHVICGEKTFQSRGGLVVQSLKFGFETHGGEFLMNLIIIFDLFIGGS
jgi:hypothetical protein